METSGGVARKTTARPSARTASGVQGSAARLRLIDGLRAAALILTMFQEDGLDVGVVAEEADEFGTAVAAEADDADLIFIHSSE